MLALLLAVALTAAPRYDTIITRDGGRLSGTVVEQSSTKGVTVELPDGTLRRLDPGTVVRVEFADGSVFAPEPASPEAGQGTPAPAPQAPAAPAPSAPPQPAPAPQPAPGREPGRVQGPLDTIFLVGGGRVRGRVIEELPRDGVTIEVPDGTIRRYGPEQIARIEYGDGTVSRRREVRPPPPRRPPPPPDSPPGYGPPGYGPPGYGPPGYGPPGYGPPPGSPAQAPVAPARPIGRPAIVPVFAAIGLGGVGFGGDLARDVRASDVLDGQLDIFLEGGVRLTPAIALGLYLDVGVGDPASPVRAACSAAGTDCTATTGKLGLLLRHTWDPAGRTSPWLAAGTGLAMANVSYTPFGTHHSTDLFTYKGREVLRLMGGVDLRSNPVFGIGLYAGVSWTTFSRFEDQLGSTSIPDRRFHGMAEGGIRVTLFP